MKKAASLLFSAMVIVALIAGCTSKSGNDAQKQGSNESPPASAGKVNVHGWTVPAQTIEFSYYLAKQFDPAMMKKKTDLIGKYLLDNFNVKINAIVYPTDRNERLSLMMASGEYPDLIVGLTAAEVGDWVRQGKALELTPLIDQYGQEFKKQLGDKYVRYQETDGKFYGLPREWGFIPIPDYSAHLPYKKWLELGKPKSLTTDEYFNVLADLQKATPKNAEGQRTYALSGFGWNTDDNYNVLAGIWGIKQGYKEDAQGNLTHWMNTPEGLEMAKYLNRYYLADMLDPDTFINDLEHWTEKFSTRRIAGLIGPWWASWQSGHEIWQKTDPNWKSDDRYIQIGIKAPGVETGYLTTKDTLGNRTIITNKAKHPEEIMKFLNYALTDKGQDVLAYGVPNQPTSLWTVDKDGKRTFVEKKKQEMFDGTIDWDLVEAIGADAFSIVNNLSPRADGSAWWWDQSFNTEGWRGILNDNLKGTVVDNTLRSITIPTDDPLAMKEKQIQQMIYTGWANIVMSDSVDTLQSRFTELRDKVNAAGLHDIEKYRTNVYLDRVKRWGK